jgi:DNA polymerase-1
MAKQKQTLIIIDGNALIHRSFHALPPTMKNKKGEVVNAVYGFTSFLLKALLEFKPDFVALTLDRKAPTFRHEAFKEYKAQRVKAPDELYEQIPLVKEVATAFNIPIFEQDGYEADDLIGTICKKINVLNQKKGTLIESIIITGDLDTLQLVNDEVKVYTMSRGLADSVVYDIEAVKERFNLSPEQMIDYKALRGDTSDNIPGVKGIGEKTASELLKKFKTLDLLYSYLEKDLARAEKELRPKVFQALREHKQEAYLAKELVTIFCEAPLSLNLEELSFSFNLETVMTVLGELEFRSLIGKVKEVANGRIKENKQSNQSNKNNQNDFTDKFIRNNNLFNYQLIDNEEKFQSFLKKLKKQKQFVIDSETSSLDPITTEILGLSFAWQEGEAYYLDLQNSNDLQAKTLFNYQEAKNNHSWLEQIRPILENEDIKKIGHNIKFDFRVLKNRGIILRGLYIDTMIASYLLHPENHQHNLDALIFNEFAFEKINHDDLLGVGKEKLSFSQVAKERMAIYSCEDADWTNRLWPKLWERIKKEKLEELFKTIEMPLIPVLAEMEDNGILINVSCLKKLEQELALKLKKLEQEIQDLAGEKFNVNSTKQLKEILFEKLQLSSKGIKKTKTGFSTAADELAKIKDLHPIVPLLQEYRELNKLYTTYITSLPELINIKTGRLHTSFNQTITATGRLSSTDPNLQNIPVRTDLGKKIREAFVARPGYKLLSLDYSQIELRLAAHMSGDKKMIQAFKDNLDIHTLTAAEINGVSLEEVTSSMRREAKAVNFGILYGQGPHGLSQNANIPYGQAKNFIDKYFQVYEGVRKFIDKTIAQAAKTGYSETLFGRVRYLPDINSEAVQIRRAAERTAINTPLQGTAADIIKLAMINIFKSIIIDNKEEISLLLQVHDELIFEVKTDKINNYQPRLKELMESVITLKVPLIVEGVVSDNWGEK